MAVETALIFLRGLSQGRMIAPVTIIFGPQAFLREYVLRNLQRRLNSAGYIYRAFQIAGADHYEALAHELQEPDLFAPKRLVVGRVLRSYRERGGDDDSAIQGRAATASAEEGTVIEASTHLDPDVRLAIVYERDNVPARMRRSSEVTGTLVNCMRPFDNQLPQYAEFFARELGIKLTMKQAELLVAHYAGDLAGIANALEKAAIGHGDDGKASLHEQGASGAVRIPELFEIAESLVQRGVGETLALFDRAIQTGRDPIEILSLELIPQIRRMLIAATLISGQKKDAKTVSAVLGVAPSSPLVSRAIEGARRFGLQGLERIHARACELDASFKNGMIAEREQALAALVLELVAPIK